MDERRRRFEAQILPHLDAANNLARWLARDPAAADDIVQDAMLRAYRGFDGLRGDARPWLLTIVRNCHRTAFKQTARRGHVPLPDDGQKMAAEMISNDPDPEVRMANIDQARKLNEAIASLPDEFREALVLREMEDLSYRQIAAVTGSPIGTVMSRLARARAMLREKWLSGAGHDMQ